MEKLRRKNNSKGTARAIVIALAAIALALISIFAPILSVKMEEWRESYDLAQARFAYSDVMIAAVANDDSAEYEGVRIKQADGSFKVVISPLRQAKNGWTMRTGNMTVGDVPSSEWWGKPKAHGKCIVRYNDGIGNCEIIWGNRYGEKWRKYVMDLGSTSGKQKDNEELYKAATEHITYVQRREADIDAIDVIADYMVGKTPDQIRNIVGESRAKKALKGEKVSLLTYCIDKDSYDITLKDPCKSLKFLDDLGYKGKKLKSTTVDKTEIRTMSDYIFVSDKLIGEPGTESKLMVKLSFDKNNKQCVKAEVWFEGLKAEGLRGVVE